MFETSSTVLLEVILFSVLVNSDVNWRRIEICPFSEEEWRHQAKKHSCETKTQLKYHCMLDDIGNSIETCMAVREFKNGCPWIYVTPDGKLFPANTGTQCKGNIYCPTPEESFLTDELFKYPACLVDESKRANFTLEVYVTSSPDENNRPNANSTHTQLKEWKVVLVVSLAVLLLGCTILIIVAYYRLRTDRRDKETERDTEEGIDLIPKEGVVATKPPEAMRGGENQKSTGKSEPITSNVEERDTEEGIDLIPKEGVVATKPPEAMREGENQKSTGKSEPITMNVEERDTEEGIDLIPKEGVVATKPPEAMRGGENQKSTGKSEPITMNVEEEGVVATKPPEAIRGREKQKSVGKSQPLIMKVEEPVQKFIVVQTEAIREAKEKIEKERMVILVGDIGSGKTTSAEDVCKHFLETAEWKWIVKTDHSFLKTINDTEIGKDTDRILLCMDDCCGKYNTDCVKMDQIQKTLKTLRVLTRADSDWKRVILTLTCAQFNRVLSSQTEIDRPPLANCAVYLSQISADDKRDILEQHISSKGRSREGNPGIDMIKTFEEKQFPSSLAVLGWPLVCKLLTIPYIAQNSENFVENPFGTIVKGVESLRETNTALYCGFIYMMLQGGTFDYSSLYHECLSSVLKLYAVLPKDHHDLAISKMLITEQLKNVPEYFKFHNGKFIFCHDILTIALFCSFYKRHPNDTIRLCDLQIIADLFRPECDDGSNCDGLALLARKYMEEYEKDQFTVQPIKKEDDSTRENKDEKIQYRFTLSETNRDCLMRRILEDNRALFERHPLCDNISYNV